MNKQSKSQPLALTDWAANVEGISRDCETLLWELTLHHFLRDEVLVQDEALAQSARLADWFIGNAINQEYFRVLEELVEVGVVTVIVLDPMQYPEDLKELARHSPIAARAAQIQRESRKHGEPFQLTAKQEHFHRRLDLILKETNATRVRHEGSNKKKVHHYFADYLLRVLRNDICDTWSQRCFQLDGASRKELAGFIEDPLTAVKRVKRDKPEAVTSVMLEDPRFTRNLGHLLADTFRGDEAKKTAINNLIHSAYAAAFCKIEGGACGRYTDDLHEILLSSTALSRDRVPTVRLDPRFVVPVGLPPLKRGIGDIVSTVRTTDACERLRTGVRVSEAHFEREREDWTAISQELAHRVVGVGRQTTVSGWVREITDHPIEKAPVYFVQSFIDAVVAAMNAPPPQAPSDYLRYLAPFGARALETLCEGAWLTFNRNYLQPGRVEEEVREKLISISPFGVSDIETAWPNGEQEPQIKSEGPPPTS